MRAGLSKELGPVARGFKAMVTPILDVLRPSRKQNVVGNMRPMGNAHNKNSVSHNVIWNPADKLKTTIKEQTIRNDYVTQGGKNYNGAHITAKHTPVNQNRDSTTVPYTGSSSANQPSARVYNAEYNAELNPNKEQLSKVDRFNQGNSSLFSATQNMCNLTNKAVIPDQLNPNFTKRNANTGNIGAMSGKNVRENAISCGRNQPDVLNAFNQNPYSKPLNSIA